MITNTFLDRIAGLLNGESVLIPAYAAFSSDVITATTVMTSLPSELDDPRLSVGKTRSGTTVTYSFIRSGAVVGSSGDYLNAMALIDSLTGGYVLSAVTVPSLLHTSAFDVEVDWKVTVRRG